MKYLDRGLVAMQSLKAKLFARISRRLKVEKAGLFRRRPKAPRVYA